MSGQMCHQMAMMTIAGDRMGAASRISVPRRHPMHRARQVSGCEDAIDRASTGTNEGWECSVFTGNYVTGDVDAAYLNKLEAARNDENMSQASAGDSSDNGIIDLYNDED